MDVVDVDGRVAQTGPVRRDGSGELVQHVNTMRVLCELSLQVPKVIPTDLDPVVPALFNYLKMYASKGGLKWLVVLG